jgi:hypothetical protein
MPAFWNSFKEAVETCVKTYNSNCEQNQVTIAGDEEIRIRQTAPFAATVTIQKDGLNISALYDGGQLVPHEYTLTSKPDRLAMEMLKPVLFPDEDRKEFFVGQV